MIVLPQGVCVAFHEDAEPLLIDGERFSDYVRAGYTVVWYGPGVRIGKRKPKPRKKRTRS